jgi:D-alanyl-D-alanine carboxypeptidase (penicillin-binding protein 5/6)
MRGPRRPLVVSTLAALTIFFFPMLGGSPAESAERAISKYPVAHGRTAHLKPHRSSQKKSVRQAPPEGILLKDLGTGETLFELHADRLMPPASLTKIMSAVVILEEGNLNDLVTISRQAAAAHRIKLHLKPGQVVPLQELLQAMLVHSANDACLAAAEHLAGDEIGFVTRMNAKAEAIGLSNTHFQNACGFDMEGHYSTAADLAALTEYAMAHDTFAAIVKESSTIVRPVNQGKVFTARTTNRLLGTMDGIVGVKTGYTRGAGRCLITVVRKDGRELLLVLLNARQRWRTAQDLLAFGLGEKPTLISTTLR